MRARSQRLITATALTMGLVAASCSSGGGTATEAGDDGGATTSTSAAGSDAAFPGDTWDTATADEVGLDQAALDELVSYLEGTGSNCMAVVKDGTLVADEYWNETDAETDQEIFSASKSVSSTLVGIAQDQGLLDIEEPASNYLTEWQGTDSEDVTIRNLLSNDSGRYYDFETDYLKMATNEDRSSFALALDQQHEPGAHWEYNNSAIQTLEEVLERATGQDVVDFAQENLFGPIGMTSTISRDNAGNPATFMGVQAGCQDLARFGYLYLQDGNWDGEQVVSSAYTSEATTRSQDLNHAYGFLWWLNTDGGWLAPAVGVEQQEGLFWPDAPEDAYAALGLGNQIALVLPSQDMVVVRAGPFRSEDTVELQDTSVSEMGRLAAQAAAG